MISSLLHYRGTLLVTLGDRSGGLTACREAQAAYREALRLRSPERSPVGVGRSIAGVANATRVVAVAVADRALLAEARRLTREAWRHIARYTDRYDPVLELRLRQIDVTAAHI